MKAQEIFIKQLVNLEKNLPLLNRLKPNNLKSEKRKFFNNLCQYHPQFRYDPIGIDLEKPKAILNALQRELPNSELRQLYQKKLNQMQIKLEFLNVIGINGEKLTNSSIKLFGEPKKSTIQAANKILESNFNKEALSAKGKIYKVSKIVSILEKSLETQNIKAEINVNSQTHISNHISVNGSQKRISISRDYVADSEEIAELVAHEIETHLVRSLNGSKQKHKIFQIGTADYLTTEEGLAPLMGHLAKNDQILYHPAILIKAMTIALKAGFAEVYHEINTLIDNPFQSWNYALRVKRGLGDTSKPGAFTKDLYLEWLIQTSQSLIAQPNYLHFAFNGKGTLNELKKYTTPQEFHGKEKFIANVKSLLGKNSIPLK